MRRTGGEKGTLYEKKKRGVLFKMAIPRPQKVDSRRTGGKRKKNEKNNDAYWKKSGRRGKRMVSSYARDLQS